MNESPDSGEPAGEEPKSDWSYVPDDSSASTEPAKSLPKAKPVSWTASEFVLHDKGQNWYIALGAGALVAGALAYLLTSDLISTVVILLVAGLFGAFAARKPRDIDYTVDDTSIHIGERSYPLSGFKSFSIVQDGPAKSILLLPLKRFMPILPLYFSPEDEDAIVDILSRTLPLENRELDSIDKLMHRVRF